MTGRAPRQGGAKATQLAPRFVHRSARRGRDLDLRLQHLVHHRITQLLLACTKESLGHRTMHVPRAHVGKEVLLLDLKSVVSHEHDALVQNRVW
jgi:hypothetical protein